MCSAADYDTHDGTGVRDYIHVMDLATGHLMALDVRAVVGGPGEAGGGGGERGMAERASVPRAPTDVARDQETVRRA